MNVFFFKLRQYTEKILKKKTPDTKQNYNDPTGSIKNAVLRIQQQDIGNLYSKETYTLIFECLFSSKNATV